MGLKFNPGTLTSKTGLTALFTILGTGLGMYTGTIPLMAGGQAIITGLLGLFLRDAVASQDTAIKEATDAANSAQRAATQASAASSAAATQSAKVYDMATDAKGGA